MIKTVSLTADTETKVEISGGYNVGIINRTTDMLYASRNSGISAGADDVAAIPAGDSYVIRAADDTVYLLAMAAGDVQLESIGAKEVFKIAAARSSSGGGEGGTVDDVARQAISSHANNRDIHVTASEKSEWSAKPTLDEVKAYADGADETILTAAKKYADSLSMGGGGVTKAYVDLQDGVTLDIAEQRASDLILPVSAAVDVLNGTGDGSVLKTVADGIAQIIADAPEDLDTLKEISDWIINHPNDAAALNSAITQNAADIAANEQAIAAMNNADNGILAQAKTYADGASAAAIAHSDSKGAETLEAAKAYADSVAGSGTGGVSQDYVDTQDEAILTAAKTYSDNAIAAKLITGTEPASLENCPEGCWYGQYST